MTDDFERRVRDQLRALRLPEAPPALRGQVAALEREAPTRRPRRSIRAPILLVAATVGLISLAGVILQQGSPPQDSSIAPSPQANGPLRFVAPGISLDLQQGWTDQSALLAPRSLPGQRFVGVLVKGMTPCPSWFNAPAPPGPEASCDPQPRTPGSGFLVVVEYTHPYPGMKLPGPAVTLGRYEGWERLDMSTGPVWLVDAPDGGAYTFQAYIRPDDLEGQTSELRGILGTLDLSPWEAPPTVVEGLIHEDPGVGFSFDYPADWVRYYPIDLTSGSSAVVTVASKPVLPPCDSDQCQRFTTQPESVVIEFRVGGRPPAPDWSTAPTSIGGQPAFGSDWGPTIVTGGDEGHSWNVRLTERSSLGIFASLHGPGLADLAAAMDDVLASIKIDTEPGANP